MSNGPGYDEMDVDELLEERAGLLEELSAVETAIANAVEGDACPEDDDED